MKEKTQLKSLSREELDQFIASLGEKPFRAAQIWSWLYQKNVADYARMTNLSKAFRQTLSDQTMTGRLDLMRVTRSENSGTQKFLWSLKDGKQIESVYIPEGKRRTVCVSSQVGCAMGCAFCATGRLGRSRNLSVFEILEQVLSTWNCIGEKPTNIVVMGMGEPFQNYNHVLKAMTILNHETGSAIGARKITISTCGLVPRIRQYTEEKQPFKLAVSLNATTDAVRSRIMPINKIYPLEELLKAARFYTNNTRRRITFEYVLIQDINDSPEDASRLLTLLTGLPCKINLIAYNPTSGPFARPPDSVIQRFAAQIESICAPVTLRLSKGDDINGACGQLASGQKHIKRG